MKKILSFVLIITLIAACLCSCGPQGDPVDTLKVNPSTDKYRNFYEIFVGAFNDSDGDGTGDLQGIIDKLDYLNDGDPETDADLGIDGIWLTPIMPSPSYHKYDVEDYYNIDPVFGNLDVFDKLIDECHKRGIKLIIDMVLNHCSSTHPLFKSACEQALEGNLDGDAKYFEIKKYDDHPGTGYTRIGKGYYYESNFSEHMPEWNLNADCTREYFTDVADFWLNKHSVDGFRLDATLYYTNEETDGRSFLKWYYDKAKSLKSDVYMVGEHWTGNADIFEMYESGIDSFFAFSFAGAGGKFVNAVQISNAMGLAESVKNYCEETSSINPDSINAFFLSNHDQVRSANYLSGVEAQGIKMAAALYMMTPGNSFIYYGEEIGTSQDASMSADGYKREAMIWDSKNLPKIYVDGAAPDADHASYGGVKQQLDDKSSILSFYKRIIKVKNQNPAIARGTITQTDLSDDVSVCSFCVEYEGTKLLIAHNLSADTENSVKLPSNGELRAGLNAAESEDGKKVEIRDGSVVLPPYSTAVVMLND